LRRLAFGTTSGSGMSGGAFCDIIDLSPLLSIVH
jgi:hypothetical protein